MNILKINNENLQDAIYLYLGMYDPLNGFMNEDDYLKVVSSMRLNDGSIWTLPITLDVSLNEFYKISKHSLVELKFEDKIIGNMKISDTFEVDQKKDVLQIFGTDDLTHPGVKKEIERSPFRIGGNVIITDKKLLDSSISPSKTKAIFKNNGWKKICGFQTRNPVHNAHEYLQRFALNICDGLFINPSIGWKKKGDFSVKAINKAYEIMINNYFPKRKVYYEGYKAYFRYAGPREAIFHSLIRKNLGCTHFIIGRDHAGVGGFYTPYAAHKLAKKLIDKNDLGIKLLLMKEPYFCLKCNQVATESHCKHKEKDIIKISGTEIRAMLKKGQNPDERFMRKDIAKELINLNESLFV